LLTAIAFQREVIDVRKPTG